MRSIRFLFAMAYREARTIPGKVIMVLLVIATGAFSLYLTGSLEENVRLSVKDQARVLLGGDVELRSRRPIPSLLLSLLEEKRKEGITLASTVELLSMAFSPATEESVLVQVKGISREYPLCGEVRTDPPGALALLRRPAPQPAVLVSTALALRPAFAVGRPIKLGRTVFTIAGTVAFESDQVGLSLPLGPRVMVGRDDLEHSGLLGPGSLKFHRVLLGLPAQVTEADVSRWITPRLTDSGVDMTLASEGRSSMKTFLERLRSYLSLASLALLLFICLGMAAAAEVYGSLRHELLFVLRCLGATGTLVASLLTVQIFLLSLAGSLLGLFAGMVLEQALLDWVGRLLNLPATVHRSPGLLASSLMLGACLPALAALVRLLPLRTLSVGSLEHHLFGRQEGSVWFKDSLALALGACLFLGLLAFVTARVGISPVSSRILGGILAGILLAYLLIKVLTRVLDRIWLPPSFGLRFGLKRLTRPGNQTFVVVSTLALGIFLLQTVYLVQIQLLTDLFDNLPPDAPNMFLFDVQPDQKPELEALLAKEGAGAKEVVALVRSRLSRLDSAPVASLYPDPKNRPWYVSRDYVLGSRTHLTVGERVSQGRFWGERENPGDEVSVEQETAERLGLSLGSTVTLTIQDKDVTLHVTSIREVTWASLRPNFFMLVPAKVLKDAPTTYFAVTRVPGERKRIALMSQVTNRWPNVTVVDATQVLLVLAETFNRFKVAIVVLGGAFLSGGLLLLMGILMLTRHQRVYEAAILRSLGAPDRTLLLSYTTEYLALGALSGTLGALLSGVLVRSVLARILSLPPYAPPGVILFTIAAASLLTASAGFLATRGLLGQAALTILKAL